MKANIDRSEILQPDLSGNPFCEEERRAKRLGTEGGKSCPNKKTDKIKWTK